MITFREGNTTEAINYFTEAIKYKQNCDAYLKRGDCHIEMNQIALAQQDFEEALKFAQDNENIKRKIASLCNQQAVTFVEMGNDAKAEQELSTALQYVPRDARLYMNRAKVRLRLQQHFDAVQDVVYAFAYDFRDKDIKQHVIQYIPRVLSLLQC